MKQRGKKMVRGAVAPGPDLWALHAGWGCPVVPQVPRAHLAKRRSIPAHKTRPDSPLPTMQGAAIGVRNGEEA